MVVKIPNEDFNDVTGDWRMEMQEVAMGVVDMDRQGQTTWPTWRYGSFAIYAMLFLTGLWFLVNIWMKVQYKLTLIIMADF